VKTKLRSFALTNFCTVSVEIGTNDLCSCYPDTVAHDILSLVTYLRDRGLRNIVVGEILFRNKLSVSQPSVREFAKRVRVTNSQVKHALDAVSSPACFREHRDVSSPALLKSDGVHLNECGQSVYLRSVRAAFVVYTWH